jgi:hypothetical protein
LSILIYLFNNSRKKIILLSKVAIKVRKGFMNVRQYSTTPWLGIRLLVPRSLERQIKRIKLGAIEEKSRFIPAVFQMQIAQTAKALPWSVVELNWMRGVTGLLVQERSHFLSSNAFI